MRNFLLFLSFMLLIGYAMAQKPWPLNLESYQHTINIPDAIVTLHVQTNNKSKGDANPDKFYYWYSNNQINITQGGFSGKLLHGTYISYFLNKNIQEKGEFKMGLKNGHWTTWATNGTLKSNINYQAGIANGSFYKYDEQGKLAEIGKYKYGKINGKQIKFIGDSIKIIEYKKGSLIAPKEKSTKLFFKIKSYFKKSQTKLLGKYQKIRPDAANENMNYNLENLKN